MHEMVQFNAALKAYLLCSHQTAYMVWNAGRPTILELDEQVKAMKASLTPVNFESFRKKLQ